jgi:hypothetical protein
VRHKRSRSAQVWPPASFDEREWVQSLGFASFANLPSWTFVIVGSAGSSRSEMRSGKSPLAPFGAKDPAPDSL